MNDRSEDLAVTLFAEIFMADQLARNRLSKALPKGMELSHFSVLNHLANQKDERSPAQLAKVFHVTRGAMTNTLTKLEWAGHVHIRPDWDDARRKFVSLSPAGRSAYNRALQLITPILTDAVQGIGDDKVRNAIPVLRDVRTRLDKNS